MNQASTYDFFFFCFQIDNGDFASVLNCDKLFHAVFAAVELEFGALRDGELALGAALVGELRLCLHCDVRHADGDREDLAVLLALQLHGGDVHRALEVGVLRSGNRAALFLFSGYMHSSGIAGS